MYFNFITFITVTFVIVYMSYKDTYTYTYTFTHTQIEKQITFSMFLSLDDLQIISDHSVTLVIISDETNSFTQHSISTAANEVAARTVQ